MYQPIDTTLCAPANVNGRLYPAGTRVRYAVDGNLALVRVVDGPGARMPLALAQTCLAALALATPVAVTLDDLVADHDAAPRTSAAPTTASRPGHGSVPEVNRPLTSLDYHGTDSFVREGAILGAASVGEACRIAGLDWTVSPQRFATESGGACGDLRAIVRSDTNTTLSVMGKDFAALSPAETFAPLGAMVDAGARFCGAGSFREGRTVWMQVDLGTHHIDAAGRDGVRMFAHIRDTYDGKNAWSVQIGSLRVVCANTLMHACEKGEGLARFRHNRDLRANVAALTETLAALRAEASSIVAEYRKLMAWRMTAADRKSLLDEILGAAPDAKDTSRAAKTWRDTSADLTALLGGRGVIGLSDAGLDIETGWAALNAVTQYTTHNVATNLARGDVLTQTRRVYESDRVASMNAAAWGWLTEHCPALAAAVS